MIERIIKMFFFKFITLYGLAFSVHAQNYAFEGALMLNGQKTKPISYRIDFTLSNGVISGHSITDLFGPHETKNEIRGTYSPANGLINFREDAIVYTKSALQREIFCFVRFSGKVQTDSGIARVKGEFTGLYKNQQPCARGSLMMLGTASVRQLMTEFTNKINETEKGINHKHAEASLVQLYDSLQSRRLNAGEKLSVFVQTDSLILTFRDEFLEDGDVINFFHNNKPLLTAYRVSSIPRRMSIALHEGENVFTLEAVHEGTRPPNTAVVAITGASQVEFQSNLKKGQKATVQIVRSQP
jgi:hypothetical protein